MYGTLSDETVHSSSRINRKALFKVSAVAIALVIAMVVVVQNQQAGPTELADSAVIRHEQQSIAAAQNTLNKLNAKEKMENTLLRKHAVSGKKEAILSKASQSKAAASRAVAAALLDTVKQHTEELAKNKDLARHDKQQAVAVTERKEAAKLEKRAEAVGGAEKKEAAAAKRLSLKAIKDKKLLKQVTAEIDANMATVEKNKLAAENKMADASAEQHLADLGIASSKARKQSVEHLHNKIRRLSRRIAQLKRKYQTDSSDFEEDSKAAQQYRDEADADRKARQAARADAHSLKLKEADEDRAVDQQSRQLEDAKELVHRKDNALQHLLSREHEAKTALRRANDRLKDAERNIYHAQMKNEADRNPSDADLGLV